MQESMVLQQLFDRSLEHIRKQGGPSYILIPNKHNTGNPLSPSCQYQGPNGRGCAAAPFIKNYSPSMEKKVWCDVVEEYTDDIDPLAYHFEWFVSKLQECHDEAVLAGFTKSEQFLPIYERKMAELASAYNLSYSAPVSA
jgi:hypothetical protein